MKTPFLDREIEKLEMLDRIGIELTKEEKSELAEYKDIKKVLSLSSGICECCNENEAKVLVKLCYPCEEYRLNKTD